MDNYGLNVFEKIFNYYAKRPGNLSEIEADFEKFRESYNCINDGASHIQSKWLLLIEAEPADQVLHCVLRLISVASKIGYILDMSSATRDALNMKVIFFQILNPRKFFQTICSVAFGIYEKH